MDRCQYQRSLSCFRDFRCLAGACPDTCCAGWEIDLDKEILKTYAALPGGLGEEVRSAIRQEDGYTFFACRDGRCPFLNDRNLCRLILSSLESGEREDRLLSEVCREHPRFYDTYGLLTETSLSISCPEAARLLLQKQPVSVCCEEAAAAGTPDPEVDPELLAMLEAARSRFFEIAESGEPFRKRLGRLMRAAAGQQALIDNRCTGAADGKTVLPEEPELPELPETWLPELRGWLEAMEGMEFTDERLPELMKGSRGETGENYPELPEEQWLLLQNLLVYFLFRYVLRAVWDEDVLGKVGFAVRSVETIAFLAARTEAEPDTEQALQQAAVRYSREVEHSDENLDLLYDEVWREYSGQ